MSGSLNKFSFEIVKSGIFKEINNFQDFLNRVSKTKEFNNRGIQKTKGDIFEIFTEALLNVDKRFQAKKVYPQGYVPAIILEKLKMHDEDYGYDGLYITHDNKYIIYQSKFRSNNETINWQGQNGLSSFVGVTNKADYYHLVSSPSDITKYFLKIENIILSTGHELQNLDINIFKRIEKWLNQKPINNIGTHYPDKYQVDAINKIKHEFKINSRASVVMACGTGKTDIGYWIYKNYNPKLALVLVPSIALVKQIRSDWLSQMDQKVMTFQLCSSKDTTRQEDEYIIEKKDLGMTIETDPQALRKWLKQNSNIKKIIFSTYQSSKNIKKALNKNQFIDLAVFDEAHRTATVNRNIDSNFNFALFDKNIKIKKRLFMTATRRILSSNQVDNVGSGKVLISMDNKKLYGNICYNLSFYEAAKKYKAIARPKLIVSEVISNEVDPLITKISATDVKGEKIKSEYLANQISLKKAIDKKKVKKIFCFHKTVSQARTFSDGNKPSSIGFHLKNFYTDYVSGAMRMKIRERKMQLFKNNQNSIISNARCLIEGVDVPVVGMVSFISPKQSEIDIVQAIGRALRNRNDPSKKFGYVHVPVFINKSKNQKISDAIEKSNFDNLILIIKALKEHDEEISQIINDIIISESRGKGFANTAIEKLSNFIESSHPIISKKLLNKAIKSKVIEKLRLKWDEMIGRFLAFKDMYGHTNVTREYKDFIELYEWILSVRIKKQKNQLQQFQINELEKIGFNWIDHRVDIKDSNQFLTLKALTKKFGIDWSTGVKLRKDKKIKPVGRGFRIGVGVTDLYKDYSEKEFLKICNIDFFDTKNYVTANQLAEKFNLQTSILKKALKKYSVGKSLSSRGVTEYFKNYNEKEICKFLNIDFLNRKGLYTLKGISSLISPKNNKFKTIKKMFETGLIKTVGKSLSNTGVSYYFKKLTKNQFKKILKIDFIDTDGLETIKSLSKILKIDRGTLEKYQKHLKYAGMGISSAMPKNSKFPFGRSKYYYPITKREFEKKLGLYKTNIKTFTIRSLHREIKKKYKFAPSRTKLKSLLENNKIYPISRYITPAGLSDLYKMINDKEYKKILKIDFIIPPKNAMQLYKIENKLNIPWAERKKLVKKNMIKFAGYGYFGNKRIKLYYLPDKKDYNN